MHYVIIGASAAGMSAAQTLRKLDGAAEITVISGEKDVAYSRCLTTYYISGSIPREGMFVRDAREISGLKAEFITGVEVKHVEPAAKILTCSDGRKIKYDRLLVASGASPVMPDLPGLAGPGVYPLRTIDDAEKIAAQLPRTTSAVVLGDGLVAVTSALALGARGLKVSLVGIAPHILATFLDANAAQRLQARMAQLGIDLCMGQTFKQVVRDEQGRLTGVCISDGCLVEAQTAVVAVGVRPNLDFLRDTGVLKEYGLLVNETMATNLPDIFGAGDAAQCYDIVRQKAVWNPIWPNAVEQGYFAAVNMAGAAKPYPGCTNMNSLNIGGIPVVCVGAANSPEPGDETAVIYDTSARYEKLVMRANRLLGFILVGNTEKAGVLTSLVLQQSISPTQKANLLDGRRSYTRMAGVAAGRI